jgi:hypothetical protein
MLESGRALKTATILLFLSATGCASENIPASAKTSPLPTFLVGCHVTSDQTTREVWTHSTPEIGHGFLEGEGYSLTDMGYRLSETMKISHGENGLIFAAEPSGQTEIIFLQTGHQAAPQDEISFANTDHDFPQRITYIRGESFMLAQISMNDGSRLMEWKFSACSAR